MANAINAANASNSAEPMSCKIAITVIPAERFFLGTRSSLDWKIGNDCTLRVTGRKLERIVTLAMWRNEATYLAPKYVLLAKKVLPGKQ
jgi:hypothetical protein